MNSGYSPVNARSARARSISLLPLCSLILITTCYAGVDTTQVNSSDRSASGSEKQGPPRGRGAGIMRAGQYSFTIRPDSQNSNSPLHVAVQSSDWQSIKKLLAGGADINGFDNNQRTPLELAIESGRDDIARRLVESGAKVNPPGKKVALVPHKSPRLGAPAAGAAAAGKEHGPGEFFRFPSSPLLLALKRKNEPMAMFLLEHGAVANQYETDSYGGNPGLKEALSNEQFRVADKILQQAGQTQQKKSVDSLLSWSVSYLRNNKRTVIKYLLARGAGFETFDREGLTPLMHAVINGDRETVSFMLDNGAKIDTPKAHTEGYDNTDAGATALMVVLSYAALSPIPEEKHVLVAKLLLARGADPNKLNQANRGIFHYLASACDSQELMAHFTRPGAKLDLPDARGNTPLTEALARKHLAVADFLVKRGADINGENIDMVAYLQNNNPETVDFLLAHNFDLNKEKTRNSSSRGSTPLCYVCAMGKTEEVERFIKHGADVNLVSSRGTTPLLSAVESGNLAIVKILVGAGAKVNQVNKEGVSAYQLAIGTGQQDIADYLKSQGADARGGIGNRMFFSR